ncbi:hypothetical protein [Thauera humireducens]|uniref:hypothetical protein n=1 Tax=Thauera humireducens TaxID=1134435 RepID=UPI00311E1521
MLAGEILVVGNAGDLAACELRGGRIEIGGTLGDFAAGACPAAWTACAAAC